MLDLNAFTYNQSKAIVAADKLFDALVALNDTDGVALSSGAPDKPFGAVEAALKTTLVAALGEHNGNLLYDMVIDAYDYPGNLLSYYSHRFANDGHTA